MGFDLNKIYNIDVLDGLKHLDDNSINKKKTNDIWNKTIDYDNDVMNDCMPENEYQALQL